MSKHSSEKNSIGRMAVVAVSFLIQTAWILFLVLKLNEYSTFIAGLTSMLSALVVLNICSKHMNSDMKLAWVIIILVFPIMGTAVYCMYGRPAASRKKRLQHENIRREISSIIWQRKPGELSKTIEDRDIANQFYYLEKYAGYPVCEHTDVTYYKEAILGFEDQMEAIRQAEKFIFMEYFAVENDTPFTEMKKLLMEKAQAGVEVRLMYDDVGSIGFIAPDFVKEMEAGGVKCRIFNQIKLLPSIFVNNRDHRKITVVDNKVGFTGGYNLAGEYFNMKEPAPFGFWKDMGIRLKGEGVNSLTALFLEMWNFVEHSDLDVNKYFIKETESSFEDVKGYVQPFGDSPLDTENAGENVYLNMVKSAREYVWFMSPYLILSDVMRRELALAAKRGVDIRIVTPGVPDKKVVYQITRSNYPDLLEAGVRVFEYTPGFCHGKMCVCDDKTAMIGTINLDYRSFCFSFEDGVFLYDVDAIRDMKEDLAEVFEECREIPADYGETRRPILKLVHEFLHLFGTLM